MSTRPQGEARRRVLEHATGTPLNPAPKEPTVTIHASAEEGALAVADEMAALIERKPDAVLGLATGSTMVSVYGALLQILRARSVDCTRLRTFNLDEYLDLTDDAQSFRAFMQTALFLPLGLREDQVGFPDEVLAQTDATAAARLYEERIREAGGIDLQLLGLGRNGHVAFNEPGSRPESRTRVVDLHPWTREDAAGTFGGVEAAPLRAITMGVATILEARRLRVLAFGKHKAEVTRELLRSAENQESPCTYLRHRHGDMTVHLDDQAAQLLRVGP